MFRFAARSPKRLLLQQRRRTYLRRHSPLTATTQYHRSGSEWTATASAFGALGAVAAAAAINFAVEESSSAYDSKQPPARKRVSFCESILQQKGGPFRLKQVYEIEQVLGEGAYGMVYQARRKADGVVVALKTMPREYTGKTDFEREVAALQLLSKPPGPNDHVVKIYDLHRDDKNYYLVMELIEGDELFDHLVEHGPYSEAVAASFLRQFAEAICFVHNTGLAHADLKPENLMISSYDVKKAKLKVVDFGCACNHDMSRKEMQLPAQQFAQGCSFLHQVALGKDTSELEKILQERPDLVNFRDYDRRTALHIAASEGHVELCRYLVEKGAQINRSDRWGGFPLDDAHRHRHADVVQYLRKRGAKFGSTSRACNLITAASEGDKEEVQALLEFGDIDLNQGDYDHRTALHLAAGEGHLETVELLCKAGADVNVADRWSNRPLDDAKSAKENSTEIVKMLKAYGAESFRAPIQNEVATMQDLKDPVAILDVPKREGGHEDLGMTQACNEEFAMGCSVLHQAALGNQFELEKILWERPNLVNFRDYDRRTALHIAASEGHVDICRYLVEKGAHINRSDRWGGSPLDDAHRGRHADVAQFLRQRGGRLGSSSQATNFIAAASEGDEEEVQALLEFGDIDLNQGDYDHRTALHLAAGEGRLEIVEMLCKAGADVNVEDRWSNRPLDDAKSAKKNSSEIMLVLQKYGATPGIHSPVEQQDTTAQDPAKDVSQQSDSSQQEEENLPTGTIAYCPPEVFRDGALPTPAADMWATGVIMYLLLTGSHPFDKHADKTDEDIKDAIVKVGIDNDDHLKLMDELVFDERIDGLSDSCVELMRRLMQPDPKKRISSDDFRRHPWVQGLTVSWKKIDKAHDVPKASWQDKFRTSLMNKFAISTSGGGTVSENDLIKCFNSLDLTNKGFLELEDIMLAFHDLGIPENDTRTMFACVDLDGTGVLHWEEFRALMSKHNGPGLQVSYLQKRFKTDILSRFAGKNKADASSSDGEGRLREIFNAIDLEGNGVLDPHEIRVVLRSAGEPEDVISGIVASLDLNHDGRVCWDEFLKVMSMKDE